MKINNLDDYANLKMPKIPDLISGGGYDTSGYDSPITLIASQMETKIENDVMSTIQRYGIDINKEELIKALQYDRQQFDKGYQAGYKAGYEKAKTDLIKFISDNF